MDVPFSEWLVEELDRRSWTQSELARRSGVHRQVISRYVNQGRTNPDEKILVAIAHGLDLPAELIFRKAGLLPDEGDLSEASEEIVLYKLKELNQTQKDELIRYIEWMQDRDDPRKRRPEEIKETRQGEAPAETLKQDNRT